MAFYHGVRQMARFRLAAPLPPDGLAAPPPLPPRPEARAECSPLIHKRIIPYGTDVNYNLNFWNFINTKFVCT